MLTSPTAAHDDPHSLASAPSLRIVILNWRDMTHPRAGGAERVTHEIARRWAEWGHHVTLFCALYPGAATEEVIDGVRVVRRGRQHTVHWEAYRYYRRHLRGRCDVIVDEVNTIPFMAPLYAHEPVIMFSHQLAREVWHYEAPFPLSTAGYLAEPVYLQAYRGTPVMTVSRSTQDDLHRFGLRGPFYIIPEAVDINVPLQLPPLDVKESPLTLVFVGRVVASKRVDHLIEALALVHQSGNRQARLWVIGSEDKAYRRRLNRRLAALDLTDYVTFFGRVDTATKEDLVTRAHLFVMASVREGWGIVITEANALGTPAIVYDVPGLRDSTYYGETGVVCRRNTPAALAAAITQTYLSHDFYASLRQRAWAMARQLNWDQTARAAWRVVEEQMRLAGVWPHENHVEQSSRAWTI